MMYCTQCIGIREGNNIIDVHFGTQLIISPNPKLNKCGIVL